MREIKFRAWDGRKGRMYLVTSLMWKEDGLWTCCDNQHEKFKQLMLNTDVKPLMQFTGLHDKNGKELWEGDIVKDSSETAVKFMAVGDTRDNTGYISQVIYDSPRTAAFLLVNFQDTIYLKGKDDLEVIGNIYENPELLK